MTCGGFVENDESEVVDIGNEDTNCQSWATYPKAAYGGATGGFIGNTAVACGGQEDGGNECYQVNPSTSSFLTFMSASRVYGASTVVKGNKLWVTGGTDPVLKTTEYIEAGLNYTTPGPDLPQPLGFHALVTLHDSVFMLIGGITDMKKYLSDTYYFYEDTGEWIQAPSLKQGRSNHAAQVLVDTVTKEQTVVVAGGVSLFGRMSVLDSVEIFYPGREEWVQGKYISSFNSTPFTVGKRLTF